MEPRAKLLLQLVISPKRGPYTTPTSAYYHTAGLHLHERHCDVDPNLLRLASCEDNVYMATHMWKSATTLPCTD
jgi:hypothetical protein